jgi:hypothetical protein
MVCRTYKALFTFTLFGTMAAIALVVLDIVARRRQKRAGLYNPMEPTAQEEKPLENVFSSRSFGDHHDGQPEPWMRAGHGPVDYQSTPLSREQVRSQYFGYDAPSEQTHYDGGLYSDRDRR